MPQKPLPPSPRHNRIGRLRRSLAKFGLLETARRVAAKIHRRLLLLSLPTHPFDKRYGVDTSGLIKPSQLNSGHPNDRHITAYWGTAPSLFHGAIQHWSETLPSVSLTLEDYTLYDIGCGKGRVVMLASDLPFRRIVGVELNPVLTHVAKKNLIKWQSSPHRCAALEILNADALVVPMPDSPLLLYMFNPFDALVTRLFLDRIRVLSVGRSSPIDLIYARPASPEAVAAIPGMRLLWSGDIPFTPEETAADFVRTRQQDCNVYRLTPNAT